MKTKTATNENEREPGPSRRRPNDTEAQILQEIELLDQELVGTEVCFNWDREEITTTEIAREIWEYVDRNNERIRGKRKRENEDNSNEGKGKKPDLGQGRNETGSNSDPEPRRRRSNEMEAQTLQEIDILDQSFAETGTQSTYFINGIPYYMKKKIRLNNFRPSKIC